MQIHWLLTARPLLLDGIAQELSKLIILNHKNTCVSVYPSVTANLVRIYYTE